MIFIGGFVSEVPWKKDAEEECPFQILSIGGLNEPFTDRIKISRVRLVKIIYFYFGACKCDKGFLIHGSRKVAFFGTYLITVC